MKDNNLTPIAELGEFGLIERLVGGFPSGKTTVTGPGDDAAVIDSGSPDSYTLLTSDLLLEGIDFDLSYFPLKHLGWKAVVVGISDILAMNGTPEQITVSLGVSSKIAVEHLDELYEGIRAACGDYGVGLAGGDTSASVTGLLISVTALGRVAKDKVTYRSGAQENDLICVTGDLGAAYMGLHLLERERRALQGVADPKPRFDGYDYLLRRQLKPDARLDVVNELAAASLLPSSMTDLSDGLASGVLHICRASECGARIYLEKLPIARQTHSMAEELNADPVVAALNGGGDYELLFTVPLALKDKITAVGGIDVVGHVTPAGTGAELVLPDGSNVALTAPGIR